MGSSVQAASFDWQKKAAAAAFVGVESKAARKESVVTRRALDQSSRYADLSLVEEDLIKMGKHVLVAYIMKPKAGYDYLATAAHFAAESSTGTNVNVCTTDDFTKSVDALVYYIDPEAEEMKIAYPNLLFDRNITDGRAMMCSFLTLAIGNNQGMGDVEYGKIYDFYLPPEYLRLFDGPTCNIVNDVGYLPDGTPMNMAGNDVNHPERIGPDPHVPGSPLPPPLKGYVNDVGYCPDGTPMATAGNLSNHL